MHQYSFMSNLLFTTPVSFTHLMMYNLCTLMEKSFWVMSGGTGQGHICRNTCGRFLGRKGTESSGTILLTVFLYIGLFRCLFLFMTCEVAYHQTVWFLLALDSKLSTQTGLGPNIAHVII